MTVLRPSEAASFVLYEFLSSMVSTPPHDRQTPGLLRIAARALSRRAGEFNPLQGADKIWFHSTTHNQRESLAPVWRKMGEGAIWADLADPFAAWGASLDKALLRARAAYLDYPPELKDLYHLALAEAELLERAFRRARPRAVVTSNDHSPRHMGLMLAAWRTDVPITYIQHAAVGGEEPALANFDMALLHGQHACERYVQAGPLAKSVFFVGAPKLDAATAGNGEKCGDAIGVCPAVNASAQAIMEILDKARRTAPDRPLILRLHPRSDARIYLPDGVEESNPATETVAGFLHRCAVLVADDSNIAIEALVFGVRVVRMSFAGALRDQYGIGGDPVFKDWTTDHRGFAAMLTRALVTDETINFQEAASRYFSNVGTPWSGRAGDLAAAAIRWRYHGGDQPDGLISLPPNIMPTTILEPNETTNG